MRTTRLVAAAVLAAATTAPLAAQAQAAGHGQGHKASHGPAARDAAHDFAVIGDVPYGPDQIAAFPGMIDDINAGKPGFTVHLGDIKDGSSLCNNDYYTFIKRQFDRLNSAMIYTPGDNEWTDCHREKDGMYNPLERLAYDRSVFFSNPGQTLGQKPLKVESQANRGLPENVSWRRDRVSFATLHVVGSNNDLAPWSGLGYTEPTAAQLAEEKARMAATIDLVHQTFADARKRHDRAVVLMQQADMFYPYGPSEWSDISAFQPLVQAIAEESRAFDGHVYLFNGDTHIYNVDRPLAPGSSFLETYGAKPAANLTRITVDGEEQNHDWLRVTITQPKNPNVLTWQRVPYTS